MLGHWEIVVVFIVVMQFYDDTIKISKKVIQTLVHAIASMEHVI